MVRKLEKRARKAFTIVELVIVIAVIAILAAVLIPTFVYVVDKARQSADVQAVRQMNEVLVSESVTDPPENVEEAKEILRKAGYNVDSFTPMDANCIFYYDSSENKILIYDQEEKKILYPQEIAEKYADYTDGQLSANWYVLNDKTYEIVDAAADTFLDTLKNSSSYQTVRLTGDITIGQSGLTTSNGHAVFPSNEDGITNIDCGGNTITFDLGTSGTSLNDLYIKGNETVRISNGPIEFKGEGFAVADGASLSLEKVVVNMENEASQSAIFPSGTASEINLLNTQIYTGSWYGITTNANGTSSWDVVIRIENSSVIATNGPGILVNVPCTVIAENSTIQGNGIGVCIRGGKATFERCEIIESGDNSGFADYLPEFSISPYNPPYKDTFANGWGQGNMVQFGGLIVGDWNAGAYNYDASCTLINTTVTVNDVIAEQMPVIYLSQDGNNTTTLNYDSSVSAASVTINSATNLTRGTIYVNGVKQQD